MLHGEKAHVQAGSKVKVLEIQKMELDFHVNNCFSIGLQAAIVASLSYNGIIEIKDIPGGNIEHILYYGVTYASVVVELLCVFLTTFSATLGPGYALRGKDGATMHSVRSLERQVQAAIVLFFFGVFLLFPSLTFFVWFQFRGRNVVIAVTTLTLGTCFILLQTLGLRNWRRFRVPPELQVRSNFEYAAPAPAASGPSAFTSTRSVTPSEALAQANRPESTSGHVVRSGYLYKLPSSGRVGSYQRRFVVLTANDVCWYLSEAEYEAGQPKGHLLVNESCTIKVHYYAHSSNRYDGDRLDTSHPSSPSALKPVCALFPAPNAPRYPRGMPFFPPIAAARVEGWLARGDTREETFRGASK